MHMKQGEVSHGNGGVAYSNADTDHPLPLSYAQERLWFLEQLEPGAAYNVPVALHMRGPLEQSALQRAVSALVARHETLRTRFVAPQGVPHQLVEPPNEAVVPVEDLSEFSLELRHDEAMRRLREQAGRPFDLAATPPFGVVLYRLSADEHIFLLSLHHIITDGWSTNVLLRELSVCYAAALHGVRAHLPSLPIQYADWAAWQRNEFESTQMQALLSHWTEHLSGASTTLDLPIDYPRPAKRSLHGKRFCFDVPASLVSALRALGRRHHTTLFTVLLSAFQVLLSRLSGQRSLLVGIPTAGRTLTETEGLIGFFVNTLPMRADLFDEPTFETLIVRTHATTLNAYAHQELPFERLVAALNPPRDASRPPVLQATLNHRNYVRRLTGFPALDVTFIDVELGCARYELSLTLEDDAEALRAVMEYSTTLFAPETIQRVAGHFRTLLEHAAVNASDRISRLPLLDMRERHQLLNDWNRSDVPYSRNGCLHTLVAEQAARAPDSISVELGQHHLSYAQLEICANRLAHRLRALGIGPDIPVGVCMERSFDMLLAILGVLKAGAAYLPLDPAYPSERLEYMILNSSTPVILTQAHLSNRLPNVDIQVVCVDEDWSSIARYPEQPPVCDVGAGNMAYIIYTSGSTGKPKGVVLEHRNIVNHTLWFNERFGLKPSDRVLQRTSISFDASVWELFSSLTAGATIVLPPLALPGDLTSLAATIRTSDVSIVQCVPSLLDAFLEMETFTDARNLRILFCGGEVLRPASVRLFAQQSSARVVNEYGPTETTINSLVAEIECRSVTTVPIGRPVANTQIYVLDEHGEPSPVGVSGELLIGGVGVARGYLSQPKLTAERFVPNPFGWGERLYRTGDQVRWRTDEQLEFLGRVDHQVKIRGYRIETGEIEAELSEHPAVRKAAVIARADESGDKTLVAYVVPKDRDALQVSELRSTLRARLPDYMVPAAFVVLDALPLTGSRKVDRTALALMPFDVRQAGRDDASPQTPVEEQLCRIWSEVLGVEPIARNDDFFELGGHSLLAMRVLARIRSRLSVEISAAILFQAPTLGEMARLLDDAKANGIGTGSDGRELSSSTPIDR